MNEEHEELRAFMLFQTARVRSDLIQKTNLCDRDRVVRMLIRVWVKLKTGR